MFPVLISVFKGFMFNKIADEAIKQLTGTIEKEVSSKLLGDPKSKIGAIDSLVKIKQENKPFFLSKKFWFTITGVLVPVINKVFDVGLNVEEISTIVAPLAVYVASLAYKEKK